MTAEILRVADGQVRCGRCHTQFDALERLIEEGDPNAAESGRFLSTPTRTPADAPAGRIEVDEPDSMEEITLEGRRIEISGTYRVMDGDGGAEPQVHQETVEEWVEIDDEPTLDVESTIEVTESDFDAPQPESHVQSATIGPTRAPLGSRLPREDENEHEASEADDLPPFVMPRPRRTPLVWKLLVVPLALLLIAQVVHHHRAELARHPRLGEPLMRAYQALGLNLTPDWDLHAYGVKQWGVATDPAAPGTLKVRASITNNAPFAQPYPLLKLVLEDRWGDQVRAREFEPHEYLDPGIAPNRLLGPAQQTNATISIVDPGPDAEGFRFDICLRGKAGPVCAAELGPRR